MSQRSRKLQRASKACSLHTYLLPGEIDTAVALTILQVTSAIDVASNAIRTTALSLPVRTARTSVFDAHMIVLPSDEAPEKMPVLRVASPYYPPPRVMALDHLPLVQLVKTLSFDLI